MDEEGPKTEQEQVMERIGRYWVNTNWLKPRPWRSGLRDLLSDLSNSIIKVVQRGEQVQCLHVEEHTARQIFDFFFNTSKTLWVYCLVNLSTGWNNDIYIFTLPWCPLPYTWNICGVNLCLKAEAHWLLFGISPSTIYKDNKTQLKPWSVFEKLFCFEFIV